MYQLTISVLLVEAKGLPILAFGGFNKLFVGELDIKNKLLLTGVLGELEVTKVKLPGELFTTEGNTIVPEMEF
ncbi:hypothetical protein JTB14_010173 [Gonioctena quinquepunctata]|nr:hypothetical protein JTB14_010173 [Gonioctena quinquepunctata]